MLLQDILSHSEEDTFQDSDVMIDALRDISSDLDDDIELVAKHPKKKRFEKVSI